jgi:hypothetical protein
LVSLESRLAQYPDGTTEASRFHPHPTSTAPTPPSNETQHEQSFQEYKKQVEGMLGTYMLRFVEYLVEQKWGEVRNGASSFPLSTTEAPQPQEVATGTSGPSSSAVMSSEGDSQLSSYAQGIIPDFYYPDDGVHFGNQKLAVNQTPSAPDVNNMAGNWGEMRGTGGFANRMSGGGLSTATGRLPFVNEGPQGARQGYSEAHWPTTSQILSEDMEMYPQF